MTGKRKARKRKPKKKQTGNGMSKKKAAALTAGALWVGLGLAPMIMNSYNQSVPAYQTTPTFLL